MHTTQRETGRVNESEFEADFQARRDARRARTAVLLANLKRDYDALLELVVWCRDRPERFDSFATYRFYHQSLRVFPSKKSRSESSTRCHTPRLTVHR